MRNKRNRPTDWHIIDTLPKPLGEETRNFAQRFLVFFKIQLLKVMGGGRIFIHGNLSLKYERNVFFIFAYSRVIWAARIKTKTVFIIIK